MILLMNFLHSISSFINLISVFAVRLPEFFSKYLYDYWVMLKLYWRKPFFYQRHKWWYKIWEKKSICFWKGCRKSSQLGL